MKTRFTIELDDSDDNFSQAEFQRAVQADEAWSALSQIEDICRRAMKLDEETRDAEQILEVISETALAKLWQ